MSTEHEQQLVARIRSGDTSAFAALYAEHAPGLLSFAYMQVHTRELAEDLVQELFLDLWKRREHWVLTGSLRSYLFVALRHDIMSYRRAQAVRPVLEQDPDPSHDAFDLIPGTASADTRVREADLLRAIARAIAALPPRCRETFVLVRQEQLSYAEAAAVLGVTVDAVERNMVRGFRALREALADWRT